MRQNEVRGQGRAQRSLGRGKESGIYNADVQRMPRTSNFSRLCRRNWMRRERSGRGKSTRACRREEGGGELEEVRWGGRKSSVSFVSTTERSDVTRRGIPSPRIHRALYPSESPLLSAHTLNPKHAIHGSVLPQLGGLQKISSLITNGPPVPDRRTVKPHNFLPFR